MPPNRNRFTNDILGAGLRAQMLEGEIVFDGEIAPVDADGFASEYFQEVTGLKVQVLEADSPPDIGLDAHYRAVDCDGRRYWLAPGGRLYADS